MFKKFTFDSSKNTYYVVWSDCFGHTRKNAFSARKHGTVENAKAEAVAYIKKYLMPKNDAPV
jgi:hypothetical protein